MGLPQNHHRPGLASSLPRTYSSVKYSLMGTDTRSTRMPTVVRSCATASAMSVMYEPPWAGV